MSIREFVRRAEIQSRENINRDYRNIDMLHYELNFLNDLLNRYSNKKSGRTFSVGKRLNEMASIRERIPQVYKDINYYKECINAERKEMKRIFDTYGFDSFKYNKQEKYVTYTENYRNDTYYIEEDDDFSDYEEDEQPMNLEDSDEDQEEPTDYRYNPKTNTFE